MIDEIFPLRVQLLLHEDTKDPKNEFSTNIERHEYNIISISIENISIGKEFYFILHSIFML